MAPPRIVLIGCGRFAPNHLHAWRGLGCLPVAVVSERAEDARAAAEAFAIPRWYTDAAEALARERPDAVDIVAGAAAHRHLVGLALDHGAEVIVQKPIGPTWEDCLAIARRAAASARPVTVHENFRHQAPIRALRELLPALGRIHAARIQFATHYDICAAQPYLALGRRFILEDLGIHLFDLARALLGEVEDLRCLTQRIDPAIQGEDSAQALLRHASGAVSEIRCSYATWQERELFPQTLITVEGAGGTVHLEADFRLRLTTAVPGSAPVTVLHEAPPEPRAWTSGLGRVVQDSVYHFNRDWLAHRASGIRPGTQLADHLRSTACVEAAYASAAANGTVVRPLDLLPDDLR